jgi:biopolymer transport protein ExbD
MAFSTGVSNGRFGRRRGGVSLGTLSEMNVVPLVDVVLVLLIIFMLTAHAMESGLNIEVPQVKEVTETTEDLPRVSITQSAKLYLDDKPVNNINLLASEIGKRFKDQKSVLLEADKRVPFEMVAIVLSNLSHAHFKVSVITKEQELPKP